jgi:4'-phosphopantetheinyl transferase
MLDTRKEVTFPLFFGAVIRRNIVNIVIDTALMSERGVTADDALLRWSLPADDFPGARRRSLLARALLRRMLVQTTGIPPRGWVFDVEPSGRPIVRNADCEHVPSISLAHSAGWVAIAASDAGAIGIDIEVHRPRRNFSGIAAAAFGPDEQRLVAADGAASFYRIWTLREAMAKASGEGIAEVADRIDRVANGPKEGVWWASIGTTPWLLAHTTPVSGLSLAVAISGLLWPRTDWCAPDMDAEPSRELLQRNERRMYDDAAAMRSLATSPGWRLKSMGQDRPPFDPLDAGAPRIGD